MSWGTTSWGPPPFMTHLKAPLEPEDGCHPFHDWDVFTTLTIVRLIFGGNSEVSLCGLRVPAVCPPGLQGPPSPQSRPRRLPPNSIYHHPSIIIIIHIRFARVLVVILNAVRDYIAMPLGLPPCANVWCAMRWQTMRPLRSQHARIYF